MTVLNHVGQCTTDLERARRFYVDLLGFEVERELVVPDEGASALLGIEPPVGLRALYLRCDSFVLELMRFDRPGNPAWSERVFNEPGLTHLSVCVDDVDEVLDRLADYGAELHRRLPAAAMIRDPDGQLLELLPMTYRQKLEAASTGDD